MEDKEKLISISHVLITFFVCIFIYVFFTRDKKLRGVINKIPGPRGIPLFGNALQLLGTPSESFDKIVQLCQNKCGLTRIWIANKPYVIIYKASAAEAILHSNKYLDKSSDYKALHPWLGTGLITSTETAMGKTINAQNNSSSEYNLYNYNGKTSTTMDAIGLLATLLGRAKIERECLKILHGFSNETIKDRRKKRKELKLSGEQKSSEEVFGKKKRLAFLDLLLEYSDEYEALSDEDIREEVDTFMFAGHDTTAAAINWTLYLLGKHHEIQDKVYEEIESIFGNSEREASSSDLREMKYLDCCIKESLRLFPSVPGYGRELNEDAIIDDYVIPKGTSTFYWRINYTESEVFQIQKLTNQNDSFRKYANRSL
ncbi:putative inactive cytochrome P450 family member 4Z2 [Armadillidium vulgare]|nr:putative inactive cytochrome P450 family member 4Z2 [Armadillidium vulgare]